MANMARTNCSRVVIETLSLWRGVKTIAFPSISTGAYGFPMERAARIAVTEVKKFLERQSSIEKVLLVCFGTGAFEVHRQAVEEVAG